MKASLRPAPTFLPSSTRWSSWSNRDMEPPNVDVFILFSAYHIRPYGSPSKNGKALAGDIALHGRVSAVGNGRLCEFQHGRPAFRRLQADAAQRSGAIIHQQGQCGLFDIRRTAL